MKVSIGILVMNLISQCLNVAISAIIYSNFYTKKILRGFVIIFQGDGEGGWKQ